MLRNFLALIAALLFVGAVGMTTPALAQSSDSSESASGEDSIIILEQDDGQSDSQDSVDDDSDDDHDSVDDDSNDDHDSGDDDSGDDHDSGGDSDSGGDHDD